MTRRLLNVLTLLSLLLCLSVTAAWSVAGSQPHLRDNRSGLRAGLTIRRLARPGDRVTVHLEDLEVPGQLTTVVSRVAPDGTIRLPYLRPLQVARLDGTQIAIAAERGYRVPNCYGQNWIHARVAGGDTHIPYAMLFAASLLLPAVMSAWSAAMAVRAAWAYLYLKYHPPGHCVRCGYDLRATPDRCPECGAAAAPPVR